MLLLCNRRIVENGKVMLAAAQTGYTGQSLDMQTYEHSVEVSAVAHGALLARLWQRL